MWKRIAVYGLLLGLGTLALQWLDYQRMARLHMRGVYDFLLAAGFLALGLWIGARVLGRRGVGGGVWGGGGGDGPWGGCGGVSGGGGCGGSTHGGGGGCRGGVSTASCWRGGSWRWGGGSGRGCGGGGGRRRRSMAIRGRSPSWGSVRARWRCCGRSRRGIRTSRSRPTCTCRPTR